MAPSISRCLTLFGKSSKNTFSLRTANWVIEQDADDTVVVDELGTALFHPYFLV
ncbi:MAG: hypothetical protein OXC02_07850 [Rhodobacteraceae bacterium]|nr:hypothetical protein [Paracoccaceae bacterium]